MDTTSEIQDLNKRESLRLLSTNYIGHLAYISGGSPFTVPITYFFDEATNSIISYSGEGHKIKATRINPFVSLGVSEIESVDHWRSVLIHGVVEELDASTAKKTLHIFADGVKKIIEIKENKSPSFIEDISSKTNVGDISIVYKINIRSLEGKYRGSLPKL